MYPIISVGWLNHVGASFPAIEAHAGQPTNHNTNDEEYLFVFIAAIGPSVLNIKVRNRSNYTGADLCRYALGREASCSRILLGTSSSGVPSRYHVELH